MTPRLTKRRIEVLQWAFVGKTNEEIAGLLGLCRLTVKNHMQKIIAALGAYNRQNAIYHALQRGVLKPPELIVGVVVPPPPAPVEPVTADDWLSAGNVHLSPSLRVAMANEKTLDLAGVRFRLLEALLLSKGRPLTRQHLLDHTHGLDAVEERTIDIHAHRLRAVLVKAGADHTVLTERGIGYRLGPVSWSKTRSAAL